MSDLDRRSEYDRAELQLQETLVDELRQGVDSDGAASAWIGRQSPRGLYIVSVVNPENPDFGDVMRVNPNAEELLFFVQERWMWVSADPTRRCFGMWEDVDGVHLDINLSLPKSLENFSLAFRAARHFQQRTVWNLNQVETVANFGRSLNRNIHMAPLTAVELERIYFPFPAPR